MAKARNEALDYLVYLIVRVLVCVLQGLPPDWSFAFARGLARVVYFADRRHRRVAIENLRHAFGDRYDERGRRRLVLRVYEHFLLMIVEIALIPRKLHVSNWKLRNSLHNAGPILRAILARRPVLLVTGHFGNWEMAGFLIAALGMKSHAIARELDNKYLHRFLLRFREWTGQTILNKTGDFERIEKVLAERGILVSLGDQSAGPRGCFVDFFGRPASTHKAIALLAIQHEAAMVVGWAQRKGPGLCYRVCCSDALEPADYANERDPVTAMTADFTKVLERAIRTAPEQYLWLHNRWKHPPPEKKIRARKAAA